jgi:Tfp pilus assembly protein PilF
LAHIREKTNAKQAATLYAQAGLSFMRGEDMKNADTAYNKAVTLAPDNAEILTDRATYRIENERYWDAIDDLNHALKLQPSLVNALRQRGRAWTKLSNSKNADADFQRAAVLEGDASLGNPGTAKTKP